MLTVGNGSLSNKNIEGDKNRIIPYLDDITVTSPGIRIAYISEHFFDYVAFSPSQASVHTVQRESVNDGRLGERVERIAWTERECVVWKSMEGKRVCAAWKEREWRRG